MVLFAAFTRALFTLVAALRRLARLTVKAALVVNEAVSSRPAPPTQLSTIWLSVTLGAAGPSGISVGVNGAGATVKPAVLTKVLPISVPLTLCTLDSSTLMKWVTLISWAAGV